ncbi:MAG: response regulator [Bacteroidales bacterium]|nr:response regulator [Bacteroidales bacterium]
MKSDKIRILFVEDVEVDMELAERELHKENFKFISERVDNKQDLISKLRSFKPDIVISDYSLPSFNGLDALQTTLHVSPGIPVILFTGSVNEETAVNCMKAGATDYVLKDKLKRLPFAVREALAQTEIIKDREKAEQALRDSEERYRTFMDSTNDMAYLKDENFRYILINKANQGFFNRHEADIVGKTDYELMENDVATNCRFSDINAIESGSLIVSVEKIGMHTFESRKFPVLLNNGKTGVGGFIRDITSQLETENQLRLHGTALNAAANAIMITDPSGCILSVNPAFTTLTGYKASEVIGRNPKDIIRSGIHNPDFYKTLWHTILKGDVWKGEMINRRKNGSFYNEELTITPVFDKDGKITQFVSIKQDITERKMAELAIEASERKYRQLVDNALIGIYTATLDGTFINVNDPLCQILEAESADELMKVEIQNVYKTPDERQIVVQTLLKTGKILNHEVELITLKGNQRSVIINSILEGKNIIGMVLDMTDRKRGEKELIKAKEKAEESDKLKTSFLANMSHEVRTPMNAILGYTELLLSPDYTEEEKIEYVKIVGKSSQQLLKIINDIVEISKIATGQITANPVVFDLGALLKEVYDDYQALASAKHLKINIVPDLNSSHIELQFDDQKLKMILSKLLDNAIKFSDKGKIEVGYIIKDSILEFHVKDNGIGISKENQEIIFDRFRQLEDSYTRKYGGSGLGLPIAKSFVEFLGGKIWLVSQEGKGSAFYFHIPYLPTEKKHIKAKEPVRAEDDFSNYTILVAEDDEINFVYLERLLSKTNAKLLRAANGQEAVDLCQEGNNVDLILMDINMPFMNGLEATKIIKAGFASMPIIAVTAYSLSGDRETCMAAGCNDYIPKPIRRDELFQKLYQYLPERGK